MQPTNKKIWFPAKTYGWGWGPPCCWQGWVVLGVWLALLIAGAIELLPSTNGHPFYFFGFVFALSLVLIAICWWKGEAPRWRWGKD